MSEPALRLEWPGGARLERPLLTDILSVCLSLQHEQREQWEAFSGDEYDPEEVAIQMAGSQGPKWCMVDRNGRAFAIGGFHLIAPGVWQDWLLTTDEAWQRYPLVSTRASRQMLEYILAEEGARRVQAMVLAGRSKVCNWYRLIGYEYEGTLRAYAANGEDVVIYGRVNNHG